MKFRVAILARVSTLKGSQDESPEHQLAELRRYFARKPGAEIVMERVDRVSGAKGERDRPGLAEIMAAARAGKIDAIAVTRIDRLFRSVEKWILTTAELSELGVAVIYADTPELDPTTPAGRFSQTVMAAAAEFVHRLMGAKAVEGKRLAAESGKHCARPPEPIQVRGLELVDHWLRDRPGTSWRKLSMVLFGNGCCQPARVIKSTGRVRDARPWNPGTLWAAHRAWVAAGRPGGLDFVVKKPPRGGGGEGGADPSASGPSAAG